MRIISSRHALRGLLPAPRGTACSGWSLPMPSACCSRFLLLFPALNRLLGEWTYGRWIMVHMNLELYGWSSLPMAGFLFKVYGADRGPLAQWCRPVLWVWSAALGVGAYSWLSGHSSGKLFLDWSGYARIFFPLAMIALWLLLALAFVCGWKFATNTTLAARSAKIFALVFLLVVPFLIYLASGPSYYPAINPDTGGPTGASQLESSLMIVAILLMLPYGLTRRTARRSKAVVIAWITLLAEFLLCFALGRADISHHRPAQFLSLGSLLIWIPLMPSLLRGLLPGTKTRAAGASPFLPGGRLWSLPAGYSFFPAYSTTSNSPTVLSAIRCWRWQASSPAC